MGLAQAGARTLNQLLAVADLDDGFARSVKAGEGGAGPREGHDSRDNGFQRAAVDELRELDQVASIRFHDEENSANAKLPELRLGQRPAQVDHQAAFAKNPPGPILSCAADEVEDEVLIREFVLETFGGVVDDVIGAEAEEESAILLARGDGDASAAPVRELNGKDAHAASAAMNKDMLAGLEIRVSEEGLPGCEAGEGKAGGVNVIDGFGLRREIGGANSDIFRSSAVAREIGEAVNGIAGAQVEDVERDGFDDAREFVAGNAGNAGRAVGVLISLIPFEFSRRDPSSADANDRVAGKLTRERSIFVMKLRDAAPAVKAGGFHEGGQRRSAGRCC